MSDTTYQADTIEKEVEATVNTALGQTKAFVAGGVGGVFSVLCGHPFDLVKVRQQTSGGSAAQAIGAILKRDGPLGLYRGVGPPLVGVTPMFAISFWGYDVGQRVVRSIFSKSAKDQLSISQVALAGFLSAVPTTAVAAPMERVKVILQIQGQAKTAPGQPKLDGSLAVMKHIYNQGGLRSVFRGSLATFCRDGPGSALYFGTYEYMKRNGSKDENGNATLGSILLAGGIAGLCMWIPVFPIDSIKSNLQTSETSQTIGQVTKSIYSRGGVKAFFPGVGAALARSFPANAAAFLGVELAHKAFNAFS